MELNPLPVNARALRLNETLESILNRAVRGYDRAAEALHLGGRKAPYDDARYEFLGGPGESLRKKHYDKSLRLLWKAEQRAPFLDFRDASDEEKALTRMAKDAMNDAEKQALERISLPEYRAFLDRTYTREQKQAIVNILSAIGHGEAYAWLVSADLLNQVKSTGARAAVTMQVLEEAKHFVVLRELLQAFDVPIPRQSVWEYLTLEKVHKAEGLEKFFGMNVVVEGIALSLFGLMGEMPGLEVLRLFHLDESRHTGLPGNYLKEFPLSERDQKSLGKRWQRLFMAIPMIALIPLMEKDLSVIGVDAFEFGGSVLRKITTLAERSGFLLPAPREKVLSDINEVFNLYCRATRPGHVHRDFMCADTTKGEAQRAVEQDILAA